MADDGPEERSQEAAQEHSEQERPEQKLEDTAPLADSGRARRAPPTIDLEPSEVSSETRHATSIRGSRV